jgi:hypothetical protein
VQALRYPLRRVGDRLLVRVFLILAQCFVQVRVRNRRRRVACWKRVFEGFIQRCIADLGFFFWRVSVLTKAEGRIAISYWFIHRTPYMSV